MVNGRQCFAPGALSVVFIWSAKGVDYALVIDISQTSLADNDGLHAILGVFSRAILTSVVWIFDSTGSALVELILGAVRALMIWHCVVTEPTWFEVVHRAVWPFVVRVLHSAESAGVESVFRAASRGGSLKLSFSKISTK